MFPSSSKTVQNLHTVLRASRVGRAGSSSSTSSRRFTTTALPPGSAARPIIPIQRLDPRALAYRQAARVRVSPISSRKRGIHSSHPAGNGNRNGDGTSPSTLTLAEYDRVSDRDMEKLHEALEELCEEIGPDDWEVEYSSGVMTLSLPPHGTYVLNKQPPNMQIWISSPLSGPGRFDYALPSSSSSSSPSSSADGRGEASGSAETWVHHRNSAIRLDELLDLELRELVEKQGKDASDWEGVHL